MNGVLVTNPDALRQTFAPLIGLPAWFVRKGYGSSLTMEFGNPHLKIRQPKTASPQVSDQVRRALARRLVLPRGDWHLWIYCCHWRVIAEDREIACSESPDHQIADAAREIDGQLLTTVEADPAKGTSGFAFDAGAKIQTWPWDEGNDEQWMLFMASGNVFAYRADGRYSLGPATAPTGADEWRDLSLDSQG